MAKGIELDNLPYHVGAKYMRWLLRSPYYHREFVHMERIPENSILIFGPNHSNAAIDALAVLMWYPKPAVFVARADIFKKKFQASLLNFCKIMPIMRMRDGWDSLQKNQEIIDESVRVLMAGVPFVIMSEGTHRTLRNQLPIQKGMFRIAIQAHNKAGGEKDVQIVPWGIDYGSYGRYRTSMVIEAGNPINISQYLREHPEQTEQEQINHMRDMFTKELLKVHLIVPNNGYYEPLYEALQIAGTPLAKQLNGNQCSHYERRVASQKIADTLEQQRVADNSAEETTKFLDRIAEFSQKRKKLHISARSFNIKHRWRHLIQRIIMMLLSLPYFIFALIVSLPTTLINHLVCSKMKDFAFHNSVRFVVEWLFLPIYIVVVAIIGFTQLHWALAILLVLGTIPSYTFVHLFAKNARLTRSEFNLLNDKALLNELEDIKAEIIKRCK